MKSHTRKKILLLHLVFVSTALFFSAVVYAQPVADFSCSNVSGCAPILVNFNDQSAGNPSQWKWDLGDGTVSYLQNPSVTYFNPGTYTVKLVVKSGTAEDSVVKINHITVYGAPVIHFTSTQTAGCNQVSANFTDQSISSNGTLTEWKWDFGDGILSDNRNPSHQYDQAGYFNVTLHVKNSYGCSASVLKNAYVKVSKLKANFKNTALVKCSPTMIKFANTSSGSGTVRYKWYFGNGDSSTINEQYYTYANGGTYTVKLLARNQAGCVDSISRTIVVDSPVTAAFTADKTIGCKPPFTTHFLHQHLTGNTYNWNMGDSSKSSAFQPFHDYTDSGKYSVKLVVKNVNGCVDSAIRTNYIFVKAPTIRPLNLPDSGCIGFSKSINTVINPGDSLLSIQWNFGDGSTSNLISPTHIFSSEGYYTIAAVTAAANGCVDTFTYRNAIKTSQKPVADFKTDLTNTCAYTKIHFTNLSSGNVTKWNWEFDNSDVSYDKDPVYTFRDTGFVPVQLVAKNAGCSDTARKDALIYLKPSVSKFKYNINCSEPLKLFFNNTSRGADKWVWNFGDGTSSSALEPVHTYAAPGSYSVELETWNNSTGCYYLQTLPVKIASHKINFYASDTVMCKKSQVVFNAGYDTAVSKQLVWNFGDGTTEVSKQGIISHVYNDPGTYAVTLVTINEDNCNDTLVKQNYIRVNGPAAHFSSGVASACFKKNVAFKDSSFTDGVNSIKHWVLNFGDGKIDTFNAPAISHVYLKQGSYPVSMKITDASGCSDSAKLSGTIKIVQPNAYILVYDTIGCTNKGVRMIAPYGEPDIIYRWDFGDGDTASTQWVQHTYSTEGLHSVKLIVTNYVYGCADTVTKTNVFRIEDPVAKFTMSDSFKACPPLLIQFNNQSVNATDELWDFGDGSSTTTHTPSHFYSYPGVYTVTLTVKGKGGCTRQMQKKIVVKGPRGTISYNPFNICTQQQVGFKVQSTDAVSYTWDFNDGTTVINADTFALHTYTNAGGYLPKIVLMDDKGCKVPVTGTDTVQIRTPFKMAIHHPGKVCAGQSKPLQASGAASYQWFPIADLDNAAISTPVAKPAVTTTYTVIGKDDKGCFKDTGYVKLEVAAFPTVDAGADKKITAGVALDLVPSYSTDVTAIHWTPTSAIFRNSESAITVKPLHNTEYTVEVKNAAGCTASDKVNITVTKAGGELFMPNTFSPNGDGVNDIFYPRSASSLAIISLKVINRYGAVVFEKKGFNTNDVGKGWDGSNRGSKLLPDVYLYMISFADADHKIINMQGDVALIR